MILSVRNISKSYRKQKVLDRVSFEITEPQIVALVGPNGSGKSTLLNILTNILSADQGEVMILNKSNKDANIFREISFMQDNSVLYHYLTGYDHLQFIGDVQGIAKEQIAETIEQIGISGYIHKKVGHYSLGMKQHLLLAMALVNQPILLLLDEPLNGLDPTSAIKVRQLLIDLHRKGTAILLSSHQLAEIDRLTPHILFLKNGQLMKEELSVHENVCYKMTVKDGQTVEKMLQQVPFPWKRNDKQFFLYTTDFQQIAPLLQHDPLLILDIEKSLIGSEERYQQLFVEGG
ncbi:ABC transporter ATP-binding protein [Lederbergia sp. NSJ-179]|uniref:ABC transporter ATP-binding protein n=1 Tax=Lederbergia sp. NSJ-179 TaxID=2931402 RepID=UPI001FD000F7|nr:ABC transporter ATP-binding protein [Lederbergia sp. NSJ-179]MCJ7842014.1 ABC transporter ATP-binding protein [Lederbergia sp. NSJ-179]